MLWPTPGIAGAPWQTGCAPFVPLHWVGMAWAEPVGTVTARKDRSSVPGGDSWVPFPGVAWPLMDGESKAVCAMVPFFLSPQVVFPPHWGPRGCCGGSQPCGMVCIHSQGHGMGSVLWDIDQGQPSACAGRVILPSSWEVAFHSCCRQVLKKLC